jgi:PAS domain S-box-containing protein
MLIYVITLFLTMVTFLATSMHEFLTTNQIGFLTILSALPLISISGLVYYVHRTTKHKISEFESLAESAKQDAKESYEILDRVIDNLPGAIAAITPHYQTIRVNNEIVNLTGVKREEILGKPCFETFGNGQVCHNCPVRMALRTKNVHHNIKREMRRDDKVIYIEQTAIPILRPDGQVKFVLEFITDATARVELEKEKESLLFKTVDALAMLIDKRHTRTGQHSAGVKKIAIGIGEELGLSPQTLAELEITAALHDIGKIAVPEVILNKPGKITAEEMEIVKQHPEIGFEALVTIKPLESIARYVRSHHERYDGSGYPQGLDGDDIPLISKILAVADVYEAITADRPYRKALELREALIIMHEGKETQFDPVILEAFFRYLIGTDPGVRDVLEESRKIVEQNKLKTS